VTRAANSVTPGAKQVFERDCVKAAPFYSSRGITGAQFGHGVTQSREHETSDFGEQSQGRQSNRPA